MKKLMILACFFFLSASQIGAQIRVDLKLGATPGSNGSSAPILVNRNNPFEEFQFNQIHTEPQFYGGIAVHLPLSSPFFLEGGITYTQSKSTFLIDYTYANELQPDLVFMTESDQMILVPVNIGARVGPVDFTSGLRAIQSISHTSDLTNLNGFQSEGNSVRLGWQMGVRYAFNRAMAGVEYQGTLNRVCQGMSVNGHSLEVMNVPGKFVFSIQYRL